MPEVLHDAVGRVMGQAFRSWAKKDPVYKKVFEKVTDESLAIADTALTEMTEYKPGAFDLWWTYEHMRFYKVRNLDVRRIHELMYHFLTGVARKTINPKNETKDIKTRKKANATTDASRQAQAG